MLTTRFASLEPTVYMAVACVLLAELLFLVVPIVVMVGTLHVLLED